MIEPQAPEMAPPAPLWPRLALVLLLSLALRLPYLAYLTPVGRDQSEYENLAENLLAGEGFRLDIKAYYNKETPVSHYSGYVRAPLTSVVLAGFESVLPRNAALRLFGPAISLVMLVFVFYAAAAVAGPSCAFWTALLISFHPSLRDVSLMVLSEPPSLLFMAMGFWAFYRLRSPLVAGAAFAFAFLARPNTGLTLVAFAIPMLLETVKTRSPGRLILFGLGFALGPAALIAINVANGEPWSVSPQNFIFKVAHHTDVTHYAHAGELHSSSLDLIREVGAATIVKGMARNGIEYAWEMLRSIEGLGFLIPFIPLALAGWLWERRLIDSLPMLLLGLFNYAFFSSTWAMIDTTRYMCITQFAWILWISMGAFLALNRIAATPGFARANLIGPAACALILCAWTGRTALDAASAVKQARNGVPYLGYIGPIWARADSIAMAEEIQMQRERGALGAADPVASNEPWMTHWRTKQPSALIPWDLRPGEWIPFMQKLNAPAVAIYPEPWPEKLAENKESLRSDLAAAGWQMIAKHEEAELWFAPKSGEATSPAPVSAPAAEAPAAEAAAEVAAPSPTPTPTPAAP